MARRRAGTTDVPAQSADVGTATQKGHAAEPEARRGSPPTISAEEEGPGGVLPDDGPPCGGTIVFRGHYGGNGTSSGTWSTGDAMSEATIDWEKYRPHLKEEIDAAGMAKDCAKLEELAHEVADLPNADEVLWTYVFRWGVQTKCWEDD
jgi:hypothetical protein